MLSLKYCRYVNKDTLVLVNQHCNPFTLQELYLDGCDEISDDSLDCLVMKDEERIYIKQCKHKLACLMDQNDYSFGGGQSGDEAVGGPGETMEVPPNESAQMLALPSSGPVDLQVPVS